MILIGPKPFPPALHLLCQKAYSNKDGLSLQGVTVQERPIFIEEIRYTFIIHFLTSREKT